MKTELQVRNNISGHIMYAFIDKDDVKRFTSFYRNIQENGRKKYTTTITKK